MTLKKNLIANYVGQGWTALMNMAFIPLYIKYMGIEAYGLIGMFALLQAWMLLLDLGMTPILAREMSRFTGGSQDALSIRDLLRSIEIVVVVIAGLIVVCMWLGANWLASSWLRTEGLPIPVVAQAFTIIGAVSALRFVEGIYRSCLVGLQRQVLFNVINSSMATIRGMGAILILAWVSPTLNAFFLWQGVISVATLVLMSVATYKELPLTERGGRFSADSLRGIRRYAAGMIGINFLALLLTQVDKILLSRMLNLSEFGYYTLAALVANALYRFIAPVTQAWFPRLSQLHASLDHTTLIHTYHQGAQLVSVILGSAAIVLMVYSDTFLTMWTQDAELTSRAAPLLCLLVLGNLLNGLMWIPYHTQLAHGWTSLTVRVNIVAVTFIVPALLWVTPRFGCIGAAWVWVGLNAGYVVVLTQFMHRRILPQEKWRWYLQDVLQPLLAAATTVACVHWVIPSPVGAINQLGTLVVASGLSLIASCLAAPLLRQRVRLAFAPLFTSNRSLNHPLRGRVEL